MGSCQWQRGAAPGAPCTRRPAEWCGCRTGWARLVGRPVCVCAHACVGWVSPHAEVGWGPFRRVRTLLGVVHVRAHAVAVRQEAAAGKDVSHRRGGVDANAKAALDKAAREILGGRRRCRFSGRGRDHQHRLADVVVLGLPVNVAQDWVLLNGTGQHGEVERALVVVTIIQVVLGLEQMLWRGRPSARVLSGSGPE